ncbi:MAG: T9SS type A sorting domain-containing protein [Bacteroidetes bacterium]|nr:T9SS type A sorting domain-containing protein [Bacteroidota bacterium]
MFKRLLSIIFLFVVFFFSCKKDPLIYSAPVIEEPTSPFVLKNDVYPNPCRGIFTIKTNTTDSQTVSLYNMTGLQILNLTINGTTAIVDNNLTNGIYLLRISSKYGTNTGRIVVSK